ncbi:PREDICTED: restin homolog [Nicrophorus vespilloides]|uniref:Restin homolog n=1 Tax=Nicrophorus vespilloides TaxID=110193 RepID=A0ABM1MLY2_NICVS|nr:PREDICTED: restin homolog [Nicrophorus vespilloides]
MQQEKYSELQCEHLQSNQVMKQKEIVIEDLKAQIYNAKLKVAEACHITEAALIEKDAALHREKTTQEEMTKLTTTLSEIVQESQNKITNEINAVKNTYSDKICKLETHLKKTKDDLEAKKLELRKFRKMEADLRVKLKQANTVDKTATIMKLEEAYSKLQISECKKQQLLEEVDSLKVTIEQVTRSNEIILNNKEMEKRMLEAKIRNVQNELEVSHLKLGQFGIKVEELNEKVKSIDVHMHHEYELKQSQSDRLLTEKLSEIEANNAKTNKELMEQLQSQIDLNHKWKREVKDVTEKMEKRMEELRKEILNVKKSKRKLEAQLSEAEKKCNEYKGHLFKLCNEFNDIAEEAK